jgi:hypothetical protein
VTNYKQWSGPTRERRLAEYKAARARREVPAPGPCEVCGQTYNTMHHAEDYGPTLEEYLASLHSLCGRCHAMLHLRFRFPGRWSEYKERCRRLGPQPPVKSMSQVYYSVKADVPMVHYPEGEAWWERLGTERYHGPLF